MSKIKILSFVFFLLICEVTIFCRSDEYVIKQLKVKDGLSQSSILSILQDKSGFMWFGTGSGLNRFDGYNFKIYLNESDDSLSISDNGISALFEDQKGFIWVGTNGGYVNRFDRKSDSFKRYNLNSIGFSKNGSTDNYFDYPLLFSRNSDVSVTSISQDSNGNIWIGTWGRGIYIIHTKDETIVNLSNEPGNPNSLSFNRVTKILTDDRGNIWIGTFGGGLNKVVFNHNSNDKKNKYSFQRFQNFRDNKFSISDNKIVALHEDKLGTLWIGTYYRGLNKLEQTQNTSRNNQIKFLQCKIPGRKINARQSNSVMAITEDDSGFIWFGTFGGGLIRYNPADESAINFVHDNLDENTIADNDIISLYTDNSGIIWVGTHLGEGISRLERKTIKFNLLKSRPNSLSSLNDDVVWSILKDRKDILWIGTYRGGLNRYDERTGKFTYYKNNPSNPYSISSSHVRSLIEDKSGNLWTGTYNGGLNKFDRTQNRFIRFAHSKEDSTSIGGNQVQKLFIDADSKMWIAVFGGGLNMLDLQNQAVNPIFTKYRHDPSDSTSISDDRVYTLFEDREMILWVGTFGGGLNKFDRVSKKFERFLNNPHDAFSLPNNKVLCIHEDNSGNFWLGTSGNGLVKFDRERKKFYSIGSGKNINADVIYGILEDDRSNLWLSTSNGIYKYSYENESATHYDLHDGVQSLEFSGGAYFEAANGEMFFGGINGLNRFYPESVKDNFYIPPVVITSVRVANNFIKGEAENLDLSYHENFLSFEFAALSFSEPGDNQYSFMLEGFDKDWNQVNAKIRVATYTNLSPGNYIFKVKGSNNDGIWNPVPTKISITIHPPFWKTWWFISLVVLILSSMIYYLGSMHSRNELTIEKLKTKLAADLHDNIGSGLTEISILSELAKKEIHTSEEQSLNGKLKSISEIAGQLIDSMSDIVWVVNPKRDSLHDLLVRLKDSYSDILTSYGISFKIINLDKLDNISLPMDYRQNLYLIFKEGINNAIKHSQCKKITLEANVRGSVVELSLSDDGVGLIRENLELGDGIKNIETRSRNIGGKLKWSSLEGKGTSIRFVGDINKKQKFIKN